MTQEEKAKVYDKFVGELKSKFKDSQVIIHNKNDLEKFFPELAESEEERIRKELISYIKQINYDNLHTWNGINLNVFITWLEKQGKQKTSDKVESKFRVGDWVVSPNGVYWHIDAIQDGRYEVTADTGQCADWPLDTNIYRLWTIQDAKDGDVLEFGDHGRLVVGIVSYVNKTTGKVDVNCLLENNNFKVGNYYNLDTIKPHPATKEQRDTLERAITNAGYRWDKEKLKLEKYESLDNR